MERIKGCTHNTLVKITNEYMGSQWALFMPTVVYTDIHKGSPCGWIRYSDFEINQGVRGCFREADQQQLCRCERAPAAQASWAVLPRVF